MLRRILFIGLMTVGVMDVGAKDVIHAPDGKTGMFWLDEFRKNEVQESQQHLQTPSKRA